MTAESGGVAVAGLGLSSLLVGESRSRSSGVLRSEKPRSTGPNPHIKLRVHPPFGRSRSAGSFPIVSGSAPMCSRVSDSSSSASNYASARSHSGALIRKNPEICSGVCRLQEAISIRADGDDNPTFGAILPELV